MAMMYEEKSSWALSGDSKKLNFQVRVRPFHFDQLLKKSEFVFRNFTPKLDELELASR
jgi:hypothetical protein